MLAYDFILYTVYVSKYQYYKTYHSFFFQFTQFHTKQNRQDHHFFLNNQSEMFVNYIIVNIKLYIFNWHVFILKRIVTFFYFTFILSFCMLFFYTCDWLHEVIITIIVMIAWDLCIHKLIRIKINQIIFRTSWDRNS